ncbi:MAG: hypothetical protein WBB65_15070 [Anaerolineales bacterium]
MRITIFPKLFVGALAAAMIFVAVLAVQLGIDANTEWGPSRKILLITGLLLLAAALSAQILRVLRVASNVLMKMLSNILQAALGVPFIDKSLKTAARIVTNGCVRFREHRATIFLRRNVVEPSRRFKSKVAGLPPVAFFKTSKLRSIYLLFSVLFILVASLYLWLVSVGFITAWPRTTDYYAMLGESFLEGTTHLLVEPDPRLLELSDPYEFEQRKTIPQIWDASFYDGKYFLYWGPVPGLVTAFVKGIFGVRLGDQHLTFIFDLGIFVFGSLILISLYKRYFYDLPLWTLIPGILLIGLANPLPWLLSRPAIYEAAIASGQFFLLGGFYWALTAFGDKEVKPNRLLWAGVFWSLTVGSRTSLIFAVAVFAAFTFLRIGIVGKRNSKWVEIVRPTLSLLGPLILGAALYAWYNFDRFGDILEFGHKYQLSSMNLHALYEYVLSIVYVPPSAFDYLLNPFRTLRVFPYVKATIGGHYLWPIHKLIPEYYYTERITGIFISTPFILLAIIPIYFLIKEKFPSDNSEAGNVSSIKPQWYRIDIIWIVVALACVVISIFTPLLLFVATSMRYLTDGLPVLLLLATLGMWIGICKLKDRRLGRLIFSILVWGITLYSAVTGFLLSVTGYQARFEHLNPELFERLTRLFTW